MEARGRNVCFGYAENPFNPVTGQTGGGGECTPFLIFWDSVTERMAGDVLSLEGRTQVPFPLPREHTTLEQLLSRVFPGAAAPPVESGVILNGREQAMSCASIIANAERSPADMQIAAATHFHGIFMGQPCVEVDYDKAFALTRAAAASVERYLSILRERASIGHPAAIAA